MTTRIAFASVGASVIVVRARMRTTVRERRMKLNANGPSVTSVGGATSMPRALREQRACRRSGSLYPRALTSAHMYKLQLRCLVSPFPAAAHLARRSLWTSVRDRRDGVASLEQGRCSCERYELPLAARRRSPDTQQPASREQALTGGRYDVHTDDVQTEDVSAEWLAGNLGPHARDALQAV